MPTRNTPDQYKWRRKQLAHMDNPNLIARIVDTPIATAEGILDLARYNPKRVSLILRGTAAKQLQNAMGTLAGLKIKTPLRKMRRLIEELCPGVPYQVPYYPHAELPPKTIIEEIQDLATEVVDHLAYMKTDEAQEISHRMLTLIQKYDCISNDLKRQVTILAKFDKTYRPPPNFWAQFQEHKSLPLRNNSRTIQQRPSLRPGPQTLHNPTQGQCLSSAPAKSGGKAMSDDLASQSLGYTPGNKLSLWERRAQYESWLASNGRAPKPIPQLHTGIAHTRVDDVDKGRKLQPPEVGTLTPLPPGAVIRTDDEPGEKKEISDDLRLNFAKALLPKIESSDPATAERLTNAAQAMLGPMVRADDDARVTGQGPVKKGSSPGAATAKDDDEDEGEPDKDKAKARKAPDDEDKEPTLAEVMAALGKLNKRLDNIEAEKKEGDDDDDDDDATRGSGEGAPRELAADDDPYAKLRRQGLRVRMKKDKEGSARFDSMTDHLFFPYQARADRVYSMLGMSAPKPMHGEGRDNYRRRLLHPLQPHSATFKHSDLRVAQVDPVAFDAIEKDIYASAEQGFKNPATVPLGHLREHTEMRGGHQYTKFIGRPISWMAAFAPPGKRVRRIIERSDSGPGRTLYERN